MSAPRHLSRAISEILAVTDTFARQAEDVIEPLIEERDELREMAEKFRAEAPELLGPYWVTADLYVKEIIGFLDEPHRGTVEAIWTGGQDDLTDPDRAYCRVLIDRVPDSALPEMVTWLGEIKEHYEAIDRVQEKARRSYLEGLLTLSPAHS